MNDNLYNKITIIIVLYEEEFELINRCLNNIKNFNIIIVDNAGNKKLKNKLIKKFNILKYILNQKKLKSFQSKEFRNRILSISNFHSLEVRRKTVVSIPICLQMK